MSLRIEEGLNFVRGHVPEIVGAVAAVGLGTLAHEYSGYTLPYVERITSGLRWYEWLQRTDGPLIAMTLYPNATKIAEAAAVAIGVRMLIRTDQSLRQEIQTSTSPQI